MGSWGPQLYQDDFAQDIRDVYKDQLKRGKKVMKLLKNYLNNMKKRCWTLMMLQSFGMR